MEATRKSYIITVGIDEYQHPEKGLGSLGSSCFRDCDQLTRILTRDYSFFTLDKGYTDKTPAGFEKQQALFNDEAKLGNIQALFRDLSYHPDFKPEPDEGEPTETHNLIIFFSGHGAMVKNQFYWVPYDYDGPTPKLDVNKLYSVTDELFVKLRNIRCHHLIIIADSCHSSATFTNANIFNQAPVIAPHSTPDQEPSAWALCSSAMNQDAYANGSNSMMAGALLDLLTDNPDKELSIETLFLQVRDQLLAAVDGNDPSAMPAQRVFYSRVGIGAGRPNTGMFYLRANKNKLKRVQIGRIAVLLSNVIPYNLNYTREKEEIKKLWELKGNTCVIISGDKESAPGIVPKIMHKDRYLRYLKERPWVDPNEVNPRTNTNMAIVLGMFSKAGLPGKLDDETDLVGSLREKLNIERFALKIRFRKPLQIQIQLLEELQRIAGIVQRIATQYPLVILIIDDENTRYRPKFTDVDSLRYLHMDEIRTIKKDDFRNWYNSQYNELKDEELEAFFDDRIMEKMQDIIGDEDRPPAIVIKKICDLAGCLHVAEEILNLYT